MEILLTIIHVIASLVLVTIILLQSGKGQGVAAGLGGASGAAKKMFGGGNTQTALGKATVGVGAVFLVTSISLAYLSSQPDSAVNLQKGDQNFGAQQGTVLEVGGDGNDESGGQGSTESGASSESGASGSTSDSNPGGASPSSSGSSSTGGESGSEN